MRQKLHEFQKQVGKYSNLLCWFFNRWFPWAFANTRIWLSFWL